MFPKNKLFLLILAITGILIFFVFRKKDKDMAAVPTLASQTFSTGKGWGYRIFAGDTTLLIQQDVIPGIPGDSGFNSETKAAATAEFVISKIKKGHFPPTVSHRELDSLGVL